MEKQNIKFIRKGGRIIPIREKSGASKQGPSKAPNKQAMKSANMLPSSLLFPPIGVKKVTAKQRFAEGAKSGAVAGALVGGYVGAVGGFARKAAGKKGALKLATTAIAAGTAIGASMFGLTDAAFGRRKQLYIKK